MENLKIIYIDDYPETSLSKYLINIRIRVVMLNL